MTNERQKARELVDWFMTAKPAKISDYTTVYLPTAKDFARKVCREVTAALNNPQAVEFWLAVEKEIDDI